MPSCKLHHPQPPEGLLCKSWDVSQEAIGLEKERGAGQLRVALRAEQTCGFKGRWECGSPAHSSGIQDAESSWPCSPPFLVKSGLSEPGHPLLAMNMIGHYPSQSRWDHKKLACHAVMDPAVLPGSLVETESPATCHLFPLQLSPGSEEDEAHEGCSRENLGRIQFSVGYNFQESTLTVKVMKAQELPAKDFSGTSDPFVKIYLLPDKKHKLETKVKRKNLNPHWNETFLFEGEGGATPNMPLAPRHTRTH